MAHRRAPAHRLGIAGLAKGDLFFKSPTQRAVISSPSSCDAFRRQWQQPQNWENKQHTHGSFFFFFLLNNDITNRLRVTLSLLNETQIDVGHGGDQRYRVGKRWPLCVYQMQTHNPSYSAPSAQIWYNVLHNNNHWKPGSWGWKGNMTVLITEKTKLIVCHKICLLSGTSKCA